MEKNNDNVPHVNMDSEVPADSPLEDSTDNAEPSNTAGIEFDMEDDVTIEEYPFKQDTPSGKSESRDTRPSLTPEDGDADSSHILDVTENGIFSDPAIIDTYFPNISGILSGEVEAKSLTVAEVNDLARYCLAKATFTNDTHNPIAGLLDNQLHHPDGTVFGARLAKPKLSDSTDLDLTDIASLSVTICGGGVITYPLVNSGFRIKLSPFGVDDEIKLEESVVHRIGETGRSTIGGGILAMDAIIIDVVLDRILNNVIDHNVKGLKIGDKVGLRKLISHKDIRPIIAVMNAITNMDGYAYAVPCDKCNEFNSMNLNVLRSMHYDHGKLSTSQIEQLMLPIKSEITPKNIRKYQDQFEGAAGSRKFKIGKMEYNVHLRTGNVDHKMGSYALIFGILEKLARELVGINGSDAKELIDSKCQDLLHRMWHLQYLPIVAAVDIILPTGPRTARAPEVILQLLKVISQSDDGAELARYLTEFTYDNVVTFATHIPKCGSCGHETDDIRSYDPVIDFFIRRTSHTISTSIVQEVMIKS